MAKFPYLTGRKGTRNLYYKRLVPLELRADGRPEQIWRSLKTSDRKAAEKAYAAQHAEIERLFDEWRQADQQPISVSAQPARLQTNVIAPVTPLTSGLLRRLADAHYLNVYDADFQWRGDLWRRAQEDEEAFWRGDIIEHPTDDWHRVKGQQNSYYAYLMEEPDLESVFLYCVFMARKARLQNLRLQYKLGASRDLESAAPELLTSKQIDLAEGDRHRLLRKLMEVEIKALEDLTSGDESSLNGILYRQAIAESAVEPVAASPGELMSRSMDKYLDDTAREREWPSKTVLRKRGELREFLEIVGDKPVNAYTQEEGVRFKDTQMGLPVYRQRAPFKGLSLVEAAKKASGGFNTSPMTNRH